MKYNNSVERDVRFAIVCGNSGGQKGIHLRGHEATKPVEIPVKVSLNMPYCIATHNFWI